MYGDRNAQEYTKHELTKFSAKSSIARKRDIFTGQNTVQSSNFVHTAIFPLHLTTINIKHLSLIALLNISYATCDRRYPSIVWRFKTPFPFDDRWFLPFTRKQHNTKSPVSSCWPTGREARARTRRWTSWRCACTRLVDPTSPSACPRPCTAKPTSSCTGNHGVHTALKAVGNNVVYWNCGEVEEWEGWEGRERRGFMPNQRLRLVAGKNFSSKST